MSDEQDQQTDVPEQDAPETVTLARDMGWKSEAEWRGEPPKNGFVSATEFVRRSEKILPIVNARARKAEEEASKLRTELDQSRQEYRKTIERIEKMSTVALEQQRAQIEARYAAKKEAAVEVGDKAAYQDAVKEEREVTRALDERLKDEPDEKKAKPDDAKLPKALQEVIDGWLDENPWFNTEVELNALANAHYVKLTKEKPGMGERAKLDAVRSYVAKKFPESFEDIKPFGEDDDDEPRRGSRVEGGSRINGGSGRTGYAALPKEAKEIADRFAKEGIFSKPGEDPVDNDKDFAKARERYAAQYFGDQK